MRPLRLVLDGFGSYRNLTEIDFTDVEFFALVGPTGSGKSTVIDALCFALYGTVPRWDNEREVRNALAPSANACTVSLIFELGGQRYVAIRSLQRGRTGQVSTKAARLERLDASVDPAASLSDLLEAMVEPLAEGPDQVKSRVQELLGLSYEHFTQSVLLPQGGFAEFLRATPGNRQRLLVELLAFGVYREIGQRARERAQRADYQRDAAQQARDQIADATQEAESAAAGRVRDLAALTGIVETSIATLAGLQERSAEAARLAADERNAADLLAAVRTPAEVPGLAQQIAAAQDLVTSCRERRDEAARAAQAADDERAALPDQAATRQHLEMYALRRELTADAERQAADLAASEATAAKLAADLHAADQQLALAREKLEAARRAHAAAGLAQTLHVGDDCPVCRRRIGALLPLETPADLDAARAALDAAATAQRQAQAAHQAADRTAASAQSALDGTRSRLDKAARVMAGVPAEAELTRQLQAIVVADEAAAKARAAVTARQNELAAAEKSRAALVADEQHAWAALGAARDKLVGLGAPAIGTAGTPGADLASAWRMLTEWALAELGRRGQCRSELEAAAAKLDREVADARSALTGLLAEHDIDGVTDPARAAAAVAAHRARAESALERVRENRKQAAERDAEIAARKQEAEVARELGNVLRANRFEGWLCSEALDSLILEASGTLMELSGGQYELDQDERSHELVVIDYSDAGTRRLVHTLSGGETFQASLALALALSRQVISLSAGKRELNSMFLDEGFGTLDSDTLDTVTSTLERLAEDSDRMVGVVTHVSELAERVPVRFVVTRSGTTSSIVKERAFDHG
jgi:DNA repair protein SbcC/Rad50